MVELSVAVVSVNPAATLARCLEALAPQAARAGAEVLVIRRASDDPDVARLRQSHPDITWLEGGPGDNVPRLRERAIRAAGGRIVGLLEDDCLIARDWCEAAKAAPGAGHPAIGGPIEPDDYRRSLDWAVFFCEYARFLSPFRGEKEALPGNNAAYRRDLVVEWLDRHPGEGFLDVFAHQAWRAHGMALLADERLRVRNVHRWTFADVTRTAFHHGRGFAGSRFPGGSARACAARLLHAGGAVLLPALKTLRVARWVQGGGRADSLPRALPWIMAFNTSWALGELLGYLFGPGDSAARWQ